MDEDEIIEFAVDSVGSRWRSCLTFCIVVRGCYGLVRRGGSGGFLLRFG